MTSLIKLATDTLRGLPILVGLAKPSRRPRRSTPARSLASGDFCQLIVPAKGRGRNKQGYRRSA